jgi:hypothetical protein
LSDLFPPPSTTSILAAALHRSRRRDAVRIIHRYRHLAFEGELSPPASATVASARARPTTNDKPIGALRTMREKRLMALVLFGFGIAHVIGATVLLRAAIPHERQTAIPAAQGD